MRVLLLDTAFAAAPIFDSLVHAGHDVWVMGNCPNDLLAKRAGANWIDQDYSRAPEVAKHVQRHGIDYVVPGCTDVSIETCLQLRMNSHLDDAPETNRILSNKEAFRRLCVELDLPAPIVVPISKFPTPGRFICKPVDAFSGRGITVFDGDDVDALRAAYAVAKEASPTSSALIETFAEGDLHSCSAFVEDGRLTTAFYVREGSSANPFAVDTSYVVYDLPAQCAEAVEDSLERISSALQLKDGLLHAQFILSGIQPFIVEVSRRCPGDLYSLLIEYSTGFQYAAKYASYWVDGEADLRPALRRHVLRHTVSSIDDTIFGSLKLTKSKPLLAFFPLLAMGQEIYGRQKSRVGILFSEASTYQALLNDYEGFVSRIAYDVA